MKTFSVLTVTKRTGWEELAYKSVVEQTKRPPNWIIITEKKGFDYRNQQIGIFRYKYATGNPTLRLFDAPPKIRASNLNASLNEGLRHVYTDYVIFYQDFIELQPDCFEKLLDLVDERTFVTTCTPNYDGSDDGRYTGVDKPRRCRPEEWEANVAIAPMKIIRELGGFDEEYDNGWSWDNVNIAQRAAMLGARFIIDESNRPTLLDHEQTSKLEVPLNMQRHNKTIADIRSGKKPLKLDYL